MLVAGEDKAGSGFDLSELSRADLQKYRLSSSLLQLSHLGWRLRVGNKAVIGI